MPAEEQPLQGGAYYSSPLCSRRRWRSPAIMVLHHRWRAGCYRPVTSGHLGCQRRQLPFQPAINPGTSNRNRFISRSLKRDVCGVRASRIRNHHGPLIEAGIRRSRRSVVLWGKLHRPLPACRGLCGQDSSRGEARRPTGRAADQVRSRYQPDDREGARPSRCRPRCLPAPTK